MSLKTVKVPKSTHEKLTELKPYDSLSYGEFVDELLDVYQSEAAGQESPQLPEGEIA